MSEVMHLAQRARAAASRLGTTSTEERDRALRGMARFLVERADEIVSANERDMASAREKGTQTGLLDRLELDRKRLAAIADAVSHIAALPDPIGEVVAGRTLPNGLVAV